MGAPGKLTGPRQGLRMMRRWGRLFVKLVDRPRSPLEMFETFKRRKDYPILSPSAFREIGAAPNFPGATEIDKMFLVVVVPESLKCELGSLAAGSSQSACAQQE